MMSQNDHQQKNDCYDFSTENITFQFYLSFDFGNLDSKNYSAYGFKTFKLTFKDNFDITHRRILNKI